VPPADKIGAGRDVPPEEEHVFDRLLIANRGEIAIRITRAAAELGVQTVAVFPADDAASLHVRRADEARQLDGRGVAAYLDAEQLVSVAVDSGCQAVHPGYGFLAENAGFAQHCAEAGLVFVGPDPEILALFGDKVAGRGLAGSCGVPVLPATAGAADLDVLRSFVASLDGAPVMLKAAAGGGGRGMRIVSDPAQLEEAVARCRSEALAAFGDDTVYAERLVTEARHLEVQIVGDGSAVVHLGERECSLQRRNQKIIEIAPCPGMRDRLRQRLTSAAVTMATEVGYRSLGTFEFLVEGTELSDDSPFSFLEANARIQVEHTVTEEVTGVDIVVTQLRLAAGATLADLGLTQDAMGQAGGHGLPARGYAVQARVNTEVMQPDGTIRPTGGTLTAFDVPTGPGVRVDTYGYTGYRTSPAYDSLLAKVVVHSRSAEFADAAAKTDRALAELRIAGVDTNAGFLRALLGRPEVRAGRFTTGFVEAHLADLVQDAVGLAPGAGAEPHLGSAAGANRGPGARIDTSDPLAVLAHGKGPGSGIAAPGEQSPPPVPDPAAVAGPDGAIPVPAPLQGTVVAVSVAEGDEVAAGGQLLVMEAMKMEHVISAPTAGVVRLVTVAPGDTVYEGHGLVFLEEAEVSVQGGAVEVAVDLDAIRDDLAEVHQRHHIGLDQSRPDAVARRRKTGQRTTRENVDDLCDPGSFVEYGPLVIAAQRRRRSVEDLIEKTPADGLVAGVGRVNGDLFPDERAQCVVMSYDYTVLAGTQGQQNHRKKDRMFDLAETNRLPVVFFTEGGGGRPGDTDGLSAAGLDCWAFQYFGALSGLVPLVGINSGRCFAGNAALLGCCDVVIATRNSTIGMGGPAMIEGGGLGIFRPEEVGPMAVQTANGVVDVAVEDEAEAVEVAKRYLSYFQGAVANWDCADQRLLRQAIPENRLRIYDIRRVIDTLADTGSVLELRRGFAPGMITALARIEGRPVGIVANNPAHQAGAIESDGADKAARFLQLCDAFDIPLLFLCDTPGIMVGPEAEKTALVRHAARMFVTGASVTVPFFTVVLRKGYGLGAQAMAGGTFKAPFFTVAWPTGEFGGMGLEGAVKLGYRNELAAIDDPVERKAMFDTMVERMYEHGKAVSTASYFEIDDVIDPLDTRTWITTALRSAPRPVPRSGKKRPCVDTW
jgi:acetyl/propionyl-CoA carboxylase alpha subunit/acetyl-CoA carboxylase carboxyltransferase component